MVSELLGFEGVFLVAKRFSLLFASLERSGQRSEEAIPNSLRAERGSGAKTLLPSRHLLSSRFFFFPRLGKKSSLQKIQIGVVSDFDLLSLDIPDVAPNGIFPAPGGDWASFFSAQVAASKGAAALVKDVMTSEPLVVRGGDAADAAARTLLSRRVRRLPVVDGEGKLIGLFSRSDVLKAAWEARRGVESKRQ